MTLRTIGKDIEEATEPLQVGAGQDGGCEAVYMWSIFHEADTEGCLLVDAFNTLNRRLHCTVSVAYICPPLTPILINTHTEPQ